MNYNDATLYIIPMEGREVGVLNLASLKVIQSISFCKFWQLSLFFY